MIYRPRSRPVGQAKRFAREIADGIKWTSGIVEQLALKGLRKGKAGRGLGTCRISLSALGGRKTLRTQCPPEPSRGSIFRRASATRFSISAAGMRAIDPALAFSPCSTACET